MASLPITITKRAKNKIMLEIDAEKFERLSATFGLFNPDFLKSIDNAEKDYKAGRIKKIKSLKELRVTN